MNWIRVIEYLEEFSLRATENADNFESRYGKDGGTEKREQVQRKRIYAELAHMLANALRAGMKRG